MSVQVDQPAPRLRKSLSSMTIDDPERVKYFICLKMMNILPPLSQQLQNWRYSCHQNNTIINPISLYDILVASHSTSCQHYTMHFSYYHKHLMMLFEIFLNYANEVLTKMARRYSHQQNAMQVLEQLYDQDRYGHLYRNDHGKLDQYWSNLVQFYSENESNLPQGSKDMQMAAHYWNPTNYTNLDDILIPFQLRLPKKQISPLKYRHYRVDEVSGQIVLTEPASYGNKASKLIDTLYLRVKGCYPWNVKYEQWQPSSEVYKDIGQQYVNEDGFKDQQIYKMLDGQSNQLRQSITNNQQSLKRFVQTYKSYLSKQNSLIRSKILKFFKQKTELTSDLFNAATITEAENILNYGGHVEYMDKQYDFGFISKKEAQNSVCSDLNMGLIKQYNLQMPHYTFARAFFYSKSLYQFIVPQQYYLEISHNLFHDKLGYIMNDGSFSLVNMAFFPYHSWIDLCVEFKIRQTRDLQVETSFKQKRLIQQISRVQQRKMQYKSYTQNLNSMNSSFNVYAGSNKRSYPDLNHSQKNVFSIGNYPIVQYYSKQDNKVSIAFAQRDFAISEHLINGRKQLCIRNSRELTEIYGYYRDIHLKSHRFERFEGFKQYIFDYDYQLFYTDRDGQQVQELLWLSGWNIPWYLQSFKSQFQDSYLATKLGQIQALKQQKSKDRQLKNEQKQRVWQSKQQCQIEQGFNDMLNHNSQDEAIFSSLLLIYIKYKSNINNRRQPLWFKFNNLISLLHAHMPQLLANKDCIAMIEQIVQQGLFISSVDVFGKEDRAFQCIKCLSYKNVFMALDSAFRQSSKIIWRVVHLNSLNQYLYHSQIDIKTNCLLNLIQPVPIPEFQAFRLVTGSEQVQLTISPCFSQQNSQKYNCFIRVDAYCYSALERTLRTVVSKKVSSWSDARFDFYKMHDVTPSNECDIFDRYVYQTIKVCIILSCQGQFVLRKQFDFQIPNFQRLIRCRLRLQQVITQEDGDKGSFTMVVQDVDFKKKREYFQRA